MFFYRNYPIEIQKAATRKAPMEKSRTKIHKEPSSKLNIVPNIQFKLLPPDYGRNERIDGVRDHEEYHLQTE
jgi:hypothetical protein